MHALTWNISKANANNLEIHDSHPKSHTQNYNITYCITISFSPPPRKKTTTAISPNVCFSPCSPYTKHHVCFLFLVGCVRCWLRGTPSSSVVGGLWGCGHCVDGLCHFIGGPGLESLRNAAWEKDRWHFRVVGLPPPQTPPNPTKKRVYINEKFVMNTI